MHAQICSSAYHYLLQLTNAMQEVRKACRTHLLCSYQFTSDVAGAVPAVETTINLNVDETSQPAVNID